MGNYYEDQIKYEQENIKQYQERLSNIQTMLHVLTKFAVSSYNLEEQRLAKYYTRFASASSTRMKLHYLKKMIEYLDKCSDNSIHFNLDIKQVQVEQTKNLYPKYRQQLEYAEMHMRHYIEDDIARLCNEYFDLINRIEDSRKRLRELQKEAQTGRKAEEKEKRPRTVRGHVEEEKEEIPPPRFIQLLAHKMYNEKEVKMTAQEWNDFVQSKYNEICNEIL